MSKRPNITNIVSGWFSQTTLNDNFNSITEQFDKFLSRDGSTPNAMEADLDMNSNDVINVNEVRASKIFSGGTQIVDAKSVPSWESNWTTSTNYVVNDYVKSGGNVYICLEEHTSGTFSSDLSSGKWELFVSKGDAGAGTGDMLAANNLDDVASIATARENLVGPYGYGEITPAVPNDNLNDAPLGTITSFSGSATNHPSGAAGGGIVLTFARAAGAITQIAHVIGAGGPNEVYSRSYFTNNWTAWKDVGLDVLDEDDMSSNSATQPPSQQSVKAYVDNSVWTTTAPESTSAVIVASFTDLPAELSTIEVLFDQVSINTADEIRVRIGTGGTLTITGYVGGSSRGTTGTSSTTHAPIVRSTAGDEFTGTMTFRRLSGNLWQWTLQGFDDIGVGVTGGGRIELAGELDVLSVSRAGTGFFNNGQVALRYM